MLELVIFDADGVLFESAESNTAYYNAIFAAIGEPPLSPDEERAGIFMAATQVFELRAREEQAKMARMREVARTIDFTPFFKLLRPPFELRPFLLELKRRYRILQVELARAGVTEPGPKARSLTSLGLPNLDWVALAKGMGVPGARVETAEALCQELERALEEPGPKLIEMMMI